MRGKQVTLPDKLSRVATIDDGFVEGVMTNLGVIDSVDMIGSWSMKRDYKYTFEGENGETWQHSGWNTHEIPPSLAERQGMRQLSSGERDQL